MTDLDPLHHTTPGPADLVSRAGRERPPAAESTLHGDVEGPTGREQTTAAVGDPERASVESGAESGAGAGILAGAAIAGPIGLPIGAAIGAALGGAAEAADEDRSTNEPAPMSAPGSEGTGTVDPATEGMAPERP